MKITVLFVSSVVAALSSLAQEQWSSQTPGDGMSALALSVKAVDANVGWTVNKGGWVFRTTDAGVNWVRVTAPNTTYSVWDVDAVDANTAMLVSSSDVGGDASIHRTTDGGATWEKVFSLVAPGAFLGAIEMVNSQYGIAQGDPMNGRWVLLRTTDGGATWNQMPNAPTQNGKEAGFIHGLATYGSNCIWFSNDRFPYRIYRSTDAGVSWTYASPAHSGVTPGIWFFDANTGIAVSYIGEASRTTDGGVTWSSLTLPVSTGEMGLGISGYGNKVYVTLGNRIYRSTDRGLTWSNSYTAPSGGSFGNFSVTVSGQQVRGWAVGTARIIVRLSETLTSASVEELPVPVSNRLAHNYPNPFNPTTTIRYELTKSTEVRLSVHDLLGREVSVLLNERRDAGVHEVKFEASGLSSGVYFCRMKAGDFVDTNRLLLLR